MDIEMNTVTLNNGVEMPQTGYGVYQVSPAECERCVSDALSVGYRMIDTAQAYHNEEGVGNAVRKSGISRQEIFLVSKIWISNYGYDWPLPFVQGVTRAPSISNQRAIELAIEHDVAIQYDETAQAPFFHYTAADGTIHEVWFEDARSLSASLSLIAEYGFQGAGIWNLMRPFSPLWPGPSSLSHI